MNCWFCNQNTVVPYGNRNCWDCPTCDQYNGFQEVSLLIPLNLRTPLVLCVLKCQFNGVFCFQNGDYNKPIPAQYMEHLNHGVSGGLPASETTKTLQWVNCQMLLCRKCNNNQSAKIKQLASFIPRDDVSTVVSFHDHALFTFTFRNVFIKMYYTCFICRRTMMRKLKPTSTTWSRPTSYASRVRLQWNTTSNIRTDNFEQFS